jgi:hypothetical protein
LQAYPLDVVLSSEKTAPAAGLRSKLRGQGLHLQFFGKKEGPGKFNVKPVLPMAELFI